MRKKTVWILLLTCMTIVPLDTEQEKIEQKSNPAMRLLISIGIGIGLTSLVLYKQHSNSTSTQKALNPPAPTTPNNLDTFQPGWCEFLLKTVGAGHSVYAYIHQYRKYPGQRIIIPVYDPSIGTTISMHKSIAGLTFLYHATTGLIKYSIGKTIGREIDNLY